MRRRGQPSLLLYKYNALLILDNTHVITTTITIVHTCIWYEYHILKARHLSGSAFCWIDIDLPEQAVGGFPLGWDWL